MAVPVLNLGLPALRQAVNGQETEIVGRELVFDARVAEPDDQFHALPVTLPWCRPYGARQFSRCLSQGSRPGLRAVSPCGLVRSGSGTGLHPILRCVAAPTRPRHKRSALFLFLFLLLGLLRLLCLLGRSSLGALFLNLLLALLNN